MKKKTIKFILLLLLSSCILALIIKPLTVIKDIIIIFIIFITFLKDKTFYSKTTFLLFLYCLVIIVFGLLIGNTFITDIINIRFLFLYPLLIRFGRYMYKQEVNLDYLFKIMNLYFIFVALGALLEFLMPINFIQIASKINPTYSVETLYRSGLGTGLGSWYASRQMLGMELCAGIIIINFNRNVKNYIKIMVSIMYLILITLTLNRATMVTAYIIYLIILLKSVNLKLTSIKILKNILFLFSLLIMGLLIFRFFGSTLSQSIYNSLSKMDLTLSGRTDMWNELLINKMSIFPQMSGFSRFDNAFFLNDSLRVADNVFIRLWISYGFFSIFFFIPFIMQIIILPIKHKDLYFLLWVLYFLISGIALDTFSFVTIIVPFWIIIGYYMQYYNKKDWRNKNE